MVRAVRQVGQVYGSHPKGGIITHSLPIHMNVAYILQSLKNGRYYVGSTDNVERRLSEHNRGKTTSTSLLKPWKLVFLKEFPTLKEARRFEYSLKKQKSRKVIEKLIAEVSSGG